VIAAIAIARFLDGNRAGSAAFEQEAASRCRPRRCATFSPSGMDARAK